MTVNVDHCAHCRWCSFDNKNGHARNILQESEVRTIVLFIIIGVGAKSFASDGVLIKVTNYTVEQDEFVIHAVAGGRQIDLLCDRNSPFCKVPEPGEYWMVNWTVPCVEYRGNYVCSEVDLYRKVDKPERDRKLGEYCLVKK